MNVCQIGIWEVRNTNKDTIRMDRAGAVNPSTGKMMGRVVRFELWWSCVLCRAVLLATLRSLASSCTCTALGLAPRSVAYSSLCASLCYCCVYYSSSIKGIQTT